MNLPKLLVIVAAKKLALLSRLMGKGSGSAAPGLVVEKLRPQLLEEALGALPDGVVLITGTNGKTSTTKIVVELLQANGIEVLTNKSGSNFTRGLLSMIVRHADLAGRLPYRIAVLEVDEAYAPLLAERLKPRLVVALNVHRDQLDRYGELDKTAQYIGDAMEHAQLAVVNADDPLLVLEANRASKNNNKLTVGFFGVHQNLQEQLPTDDSLYGKQVDGSGSHPRATLKLHAYNESEVTLEYNSRVYSSQFKLPGIYSAVNATAAVLSVMEIQPKLSVDKLTAQLSGVKPAFGRGESFTVEGRTVLFGLVKNPAGFNHNLKTMLPGASTVIIAINDAYADGRDVSWLWDVQFEAHAEALSAKPTYCGGVRAYDMALRLQALNVQPKQTTQDLSSLFSQAIQATDPGSTILVLPTYTAMLELRRIVGVYTKVDDIW